MIRIKTIVLINILLSLFLFLYFNSEQSIITKIFTKKDNITYDNVTYDTGTCSIRASRMGNHQKVIAYSVYGNVNTFYWWGISTNVQWILKLYPGWLIRVYTDNPEPLRKLEEEYPSIFFICEIRNLPNLTDYPGEMWRFFSLADPQIDIINFRDTDSRILEREAFADQEWLRSNKTLHVMRDNPGHRTEILAGMWGTKFTPQNRNTWIKFKDQLFKGSYRNKKKSGRDQPLLKRIIWPLMKNDVMAHDSYLCKMFPEGSTPYPTERLNNLFVGGKFYKGRNLIMKNKAICPIECRPKDHLDWISC